MSEKQNLPNSTAVLVMGILSIVLTCLYGLGLVLGIIGLVLGNKGKKIYKSNPELYSGYGNLNAGWTMSIIGVVLNGLYLLFILIFGAAYLSALGALN
jgi:hypothetical protein